MPSVNPGPATSTSTNTTAATTTVGTTTAVSVGSNAGPIYTNPGSTDLTVAPVPGFGGFTLQAGLTNNISVPLPTENLFQFSQTLANAYWTQTNLTSVTDNATTDPLGGNTASAIVVGAGAAGFQLTSAPLTISQQYTVSVWVKGVGASISQAVTLGNFNNNSNTYTSIEVQATWQLITLPFTPTGATNNNLYLQFNSATTKTFGTVPSGATIYVWGWQLNLGPYKKGYVATMASTVVDGTNYQVLGINTTSAANQIVDFVEESSGVFVGTPRATALTGNDSSFLLIKNADRRVASIVIAAADSIAPYASDYICTGSSDQTAISNAITALRGKGGKVLLRAGTYFLSATITHDSDWTTLEGEARGFWGGYVSPYPTIAIEGWTGGTKLKVTTSGAAAITVGANFQGNARHQGIGIKNLYLFGYQQTGTAVVDANNTDVSEIADCVIHNFSKGINCAWDTPMIRNCSIQSIASDGITHTFNYGSIVNNIMYDIGGSGIVLACGGTSAIGNIIGDVGAAGISVTGKSNMVSGNTIQGVTSGSCIDVSGGVNNTIAGNTISLNRNVGSASTNSNLTGHGIYLHAGSINTAVTGNTINNGNASASGYAVCLGQAGDATITNCTVVGNVISGSKWNAASATTILDSSGGATNKVGMNAGDSRLVGAQ